MGVAKYLILLFLGLFAVACAREVARTDTGPRPTEPRLISPVGVKASEPAMAVASSGDALLAYVEHRTEGSDVFLQILNAAGTQKGERVRVNDEPNTAKTWRGDPPTIAAGSDGTIYVGWTKKYGDPKARGTDLMLSVSRDAGRSFEPAVKVNDDSEPASHGMHSLAVDRGGRIIAAWLDERNVGKKAQKSKPDPAAHHEGVEPNSEVFTAVSVDGGKTFSPNKKIAEEVCPCCKTSLLVDEGGSVYASWRQVLEGDHRHMAVASSADGGSSFTPAVVVSDDNWQLSACPVSGAALTSAGRDQLDIIWYTAGAAGVAGVYSARSNDRGKTFGERRLLSGAAGGGTPVVASKFCIFNSFDGSVIARPLESAPPAVKAVDIPDASVPAAVSLKDRTLVAFVRVKGDAAAVWASAISN